MIRVAITVEGVTERVFVNQVLAPHLEAGEVYTSTVLLGRASRSVGGGGNVTVERLAVDMASLYHRFDAVTSLVDFYGFRDKGARTVEELEESITQEVGRRLGLNWDSRKVFPYVQLHEFEGLLFSEVNAIINGLGADRAALRQLHSIRAQFASPEDINDNPTTAPSKRISDALPNYNKRVNGPQIAQAIGLPTIRQECPRFNSWVKRLEALESSQAASH